MDNINNVSFVVKVQFRQNATWQGTVQWIDTGKTKQFRSCLELMKLIDEAVQMSNIEKSEEEIETSHW